MAVNNFVNKLEISPYHSESIQYYLYDGHGSDISNILKVHFSMNLHSVVV